MLDNNLGEYQATNSLNIGNFEQTFLRDVANLAVIAYVLGIV